jgi:hypothetical protein
MKKRVRFALAAALLAGAAVVAAAFRPAVGEALPTWEPIIVRRGTVTDFLRETGTLMPHDPTIVAAPFDGKLQWVIDDSTWVQVGEPLFIIDDTDELKKVAQERSQLTEAGQDLELAVLRRDQAVDTEERKVRKAEQDLTIERARSRILTTKAVGGLELVRCDAELVPLEAATTVVRAGYEAARLAWQQAQDSFIDHLDAWQDHQDQLLRLETKIDELSQQQRAVKPAAPLSDQAPEDKQKERKNENQKSGKVRAQETPAVPDVGPELEQVRAQREQLRAKTAAMHASLIEVRNQRDALVPAKDTAASELAQAEAAERELRIRIEIEKRGLPATQLALDAELAQLTLSEAERRLNEGRAAFAAKTLSQAAIDDLEAVRDSARTQAAMIGERRALADRPTSPEVLAEAAARLAKAEQAASNAKAVRDRNLAILDQERAVSEAKIARFTASLAVRARRFPSTIAQEIAARERDRSLKPELAERIDEELRGLQADLLKAKAAPPNIAVAAVAGLVKVRREGDRQKLSGDQIWQADPMIEIFSPANMEVVVRVNEVNVARLRQGMKVSAEIPALGRLPRQGEITQVAGVGRDKNDGSGRKSLAGVTQFEVHIRLEPGADHRDGDFRQGMTALVAIELQRLEGVIWMPRAALVPLPDGRSGVRRAPGATATPVAGHILGSDAFVVEDPTLAEGTTIYVERIPNR